MNYNAKVLKIINLSYPLTNEQINSIKDICGYDNAHVIESPASLNTHQTFIPQIANMLRKRVEITQEDVDDNLVVLVPPILNHLTAVLMVAFYDKYGNFPMIARLRQKRDPIYVPRASVGISRDPNCYEIAEVINLQGCNWNDTEPMSL